MKDGNNEPIVLGTLKKEKSSKPIFVIFCFILLFTVCFGLPYIVDYINSKDNDFTIIVRDLLNKIINDDEGKVQKPINNNNNNKPSLDLTLLDTSAIINYQSLVLKNFKFINNNISFSFSSGNSIDLSENKVFLEIYSSEYKLLTRVRLYDGVENNIISTKLYNLNVDSNAKYYGKVNIINLDDYPDATGETLNCSLLDENITYIFVDNKLSELKYNYSYLDISNMDLYLSIFNKYKKQNEELVIKEFNSSLEEVENGFEYKLDLVYDENTVSNLGDYYNEDFFYLSAPFKEIKYDMLTKGYDCK